MNCLEDALAEEALEKISLFQSKANHANLKAHKLHGKLSHYSAFSVNYKIRIIFRYISTNEVLLIEIGNHDIYK